MGVPKLIRLPRLDAGLNSADPVTSLGMGVLQTADNVRLDNGLLASAPGFTRVTSVAPNDHTYRLNGVDEHFRALGTAADTTLCLASINGDPWTVELVFRADALPRDIASVGSTPTMVMLYKGAGTDKLAAIGSDLDWSLRLNGNTTSGKMVVMFHCGSSAGLTTLESDVQVLLNTWYHVAVVYDGVDISIYVHEPGTALPTPATEAFDYYPDNDNTDLWVGGQGIHDDYAVNDADGITYPFKGIIQELRIWDDARAEAELLEYDDVQLTDAEAATAYASENLVYYNRLTGVATNNYFFPSVVGTAGGGSGQSPMLRLYPRTATWLTTGHVIDDPMLGGVGLDFDGRQQGLVVPNAYLYRTQVPAADGSLPFPDYFAVSFRVKFRSLKARSTIFHYVPVSDDEWVTNLLTDNTNFYDDTFTEASQTNLLVELVDVGGGVYQFRAVSGHYAVSADEHHYTSVSSALGSGGVAVDTEYTVTAAVDVVNEDVRLWVNEEAVRVRDWSGSDPDEVPYSTVNDPDGVARRYHMSIGRAISRSKQILDAGSDPNGNEVEYAFDRTLDGELRQLVIATPSDPWLFQFLHVLVRDEEITRKSGTRTGLQTVGIWSMSEGGGGAVGDIGLQQNAITFLDDPGYVWGHSGITTINKSQIKGLFNHRYRSATGEVKKFIAVAGGSIYEVDLANGELDYLVDGLRNEYGNQVSASRYLDSLVLCTGHGGSGNHQLYQTELYQLGIDPPEGIIPFGLSDQLNDDAALETGSYRAGFAFYSAHLDKWSPMGPTLEVDVRCPKANLAYGDVAEINQTHATTGYGAGNPGGGTYDIWVDNDHYSCIKVWSWYGAQKNKLATDPDWWEEGPGSTSPTNLSRSGRVWFCRLQQKHTHPLIQDPEFAQPSELVAVAASMTNGRWYFEASPALKIQMESVFVGEGAFLAANHSLPVAFYPTKYFDYDNVVLTGKTAIDLLSIDGKFGWGPGGLSTFPNHGGVGEGDPWQGTGDSDHGLVLPSSSDPQVTHLGYFRSVNGGRQLRLVQLLPNGTKGFTDITPDALNTGFIFDEDSATPESTEFVTEYGGRMIYVKDTQQPQRVYFTEVGQPWNVPARNVVDLLDGNSLAITGVARTESSVVIFKDDTTFVLSPPTNPLVPFTIETRTVDIGCVAPFSIVNVHENLFYPSEKGFYQFDSSFPRYISRVIEPTWRAVSIANRDLIVGVHDRRNETILWGVPSGSTLDADGNVVNDQMITWCYAVGGGMGWAKRTNVSMSVAAIVPDANEVNQVYFADGLGYLYLHDSGTNYGVGTRTSSVSGLDVSAGTVNTVTIPRVSDLTAAGLPEGYRGLYLTKETPAGVRETRLAIADDLASPSTVTVDRNWDVTPTASDTIDVGSIEMNALFGEISPFGSETVSEWACTYVRQALQSTSGTVTLTYEAKSGVTSPASGSETFNNALRDSMKFGFNPAARGTALILGFHAKGPDIQVQLRDVIMVIRSFGDHEFLTVA